MQADRLDTTDVTVAELEEGMRLVYGQRQVEVIDLGRSPIDAHRRVTMRGRGGVDHRVIHLSERFTLSRVL